MSRKFVSDIRPVYSRVAMPLQGVLGIGFRITFVGCCMSVLITWDFRVTMVLERDKTTNFVIYDLLPVCNPNYPRCKRKVDLILCLE